mgnify:CR=1 FL=1
MNIVILLGVVVGTMALGAPIAYALGFAGLAVLLIDGSTPLFIMVQRMVASMDSFTMLAVPLYIFIGQIMNEGGITERIFSFAKCLVGHFKGGLAHVNVLCSFIFAGMSGSALADTAGLGQIEVDAMRKEGFPDGFSGAVTAVTATIGPIIPPSIPLVLYGGLAEVSIGRLFMAGILPGILMAAGFSAMIVYLSHKRGYPVSDRATVSQTWKAFVRAIPALMVVVIIIGGILGGIFTPTEAAGVAAFYSVVIAFIMGGLTWKRLVKNLLDTAILSGAVLLIMSTSTLFAWLVTLEKIPELVANTLLTISSNQYFILAVINIVLIIMGMFIDGNSILAITVPIFVPIAEMLGVDLVQFGMMMVLNVMVGTITPPFAMCYFSVSKICKIRYEEIVREGWNFYVPLLILLVLITVVPALSLTLPNLIFG